MSNSTVTIERRTLRRLISTARAMAALESLNHEGPMGEIEEKYAKNASQCDEFRAWWLMHAREAIAQAEEVENA